MSCYQHMQFFDSTAQPGVNILLHRTTDSSSNTRRLMMTVGMGHGSGVFLDERSLMPHLALAGITDKIKHRQMLKTPPNAVAILT